MDPERRDRRHEQDICIGVILFTRAIHATLDIAWGFARVCSGKMRNHDSRYYSLLVGSAD